MSFSGIFDFTYVTYFVPVFKYCYSDSRNLWTVIRAGGLALSNLIQPTISLEMPVPSQGHYGFHSLRLLTDFVCLYNYEFWRSLCRIVRSSVILLLPLFVLLDSCWSIVNEFGGLRHMRVSKWNTFSQKPRQREKTCITYIKMYYLAIRHINWPSDALSDPQVI